MILKILLFVLRPFAGPIRYGALKLMKKARAPYDARPAIAASDHIVNEIVLPSVWRIFREDRFRELAYFKKLPVSEHDRIFNELEVGAICLAMFYLNAAKQFAKPGDYHFWQDVEERLPKQLQMVLIGYGVDGARAKLFRQLIEMRHQEYEELTKHSWDASDEASSEFKTLQPEMKWVAAAIQATAIGVTDHIRRGKIQEKDPLIHHLIMWLLFLHRKIGAFVKHL